MKYLTYEEYTNIGGTLEKAAFNRVIDRACGVVDYYTQKRVRNISEGATQIGDELYVFGSSLDGTVIDRVRACIRDLCDYLASVMQPTGGNLSSKTQTAGGVSESETYAAKTTEQVGADMRYIVFDYLVSETDNDGTPLLYRGCKP